jgi:hypothetical protein
MKRFCKEFFQFVCFFIFLLLLFIGLFIAVKKEKIKKVKNRFLKTYCQKGVENE